MCGMDESKFSEQQETEQLRKVLLSLMEFYEDLREEGIETPNEAEFRAYYILTHIRDKDVVKQTMTQPVHVFKHPHIQLALKFYAMAQRNNEIEETSSRRNKAENALASKNSYASFFKWIASPKTPFLMACLLETHFPEVRKGAMKAMNVGYMMRAAGVEASFVQNVLCYDSLAQCLQEAKHYGIGMDMSLEEPTLLFGQRHHETRVHVFLEPLSYLTQKKSSLVDLKKGGQSFRSIVNGVDMPVAAPAHTPNVPVSAFQPTASRTLDMAEKSKKAKEAAAEQKKKIELVAEARRQAEKAEAKAAEERRKLEAFIEQKRQEQLLQEKTRLVQEAAERQKQMELKRKEELEMREQLRRKQEEAERQRMIEEQQRKEAEERRIKKMEEERLKKLKQDTARKMMEELLKQVIKEETARIVRNQTRVRKILEKKASIWASRARARISKRNSKIDLLKSKHVFSWSVVRHHPYFRPSFLKNGAPKLEDEEEIKKKARQSLIAEQMALEKNTIVDNQMVWKTENFSNNIYPQIWSQVDEFRRNHPSLLKKLNWQLLISAENKQLQSSTWYRSKFGLDNEFLRRIGIYDKYDVTCRMVCKETNPITRHIAEEVGGVVFSLAELDTRTKSKEEMQIYWNKSAARLTSLIQDIGKHNPTATFPILITYFPDGTDTSETLKKIPGLLGLSNHEQINDFRLVIMNPQTISTRIVDEVNWLASRSSINFPV
ncbi:hypothetical protein G6F56_007676 [Rhizopus delemar]|nr:hypothetical protein G6F56_007676 [Rhizopus delemar]